MNGPGLRVHALSWASSASVAGLFALGVILVGAALYRARNTRTTLADPTRRSTVSSGPPPLPPPPQWPLLALLLPTLVLACVAVVALVRDWRTARHEATLRAQELAGHVASQIAGSLYQLPPITNTNVPGAYWPRGPAVFWTLSEANELLLPPPGVWPPSPQPLELDALPTETRAAWARARAESQAGNWTQAIASYEQVLALPPGAAPPFSEDPTQPPPPARLRALALLEGALALDQSGRSNGLVAAYQRVLDDPTAAPHALTEAGVPASQLAILRILDLAGTDVEALPLAWRTNTGMLTLCLAQSPPTPYLARIEERLQEWLPVLATKSFNSIPAYLLRPILDAQLARARYAIARAQLDLQAPWPKAFWIHSETPAWLAAEQYVQPLPGDPTSSGRRSFALLGEDWLQRELASAVEAADRAGDFVVRLSIAGHTLVANAKSPPSPRREPDLASAVRAPASLINVEARVSLRDPDSFYAAQRLRFQMFGGLLALALIGSTISVWATRRALRRQHELNLQKSNFVSSVSHELRAPLGSLRLLAEGLERGTIAEEPRRQEYFRLIGQETRRLGALVENVLDFSRIEQGRKRYEFEPTDLVALIEATVRVLEPLATERHVTLETSLSPNASGWEVVVDGRALQQALLNLLDNALKHSPAHTRVHIALAPGLALAPESLAPPAVAVPAAHAPQPSASSSPATLRLSVADQGPGVPRAEHERIFEPFYRRGSELRRETQGIGIGLSIVKHIVDAHGGRIEVKSEPGAGATFTLCLPLTPQPPSA